MLKAETVNGQVGGGPGLERDLRDSLASLPTEGRYRDLICVATSSYPGSVDMTQDRSPTPGGRL